MKRTQPTPGLDKDFFGYFGGGGGDAQSSFYHIVFPAANRPKDRDRLFPFGGDNCGCLSLSLSLSLSLCVCMCVCFLAKANSDDKSGTFKKTLILYLLTQPQM